MPDKVKPEIPITLDKERHLLMDLNAMVAFEDATGKNIMQGLDPDSMTAKDFRALLWACLLHEDESLKIEDVGKMIHAGNMNELSEKIAQAWEVASPEARGDKSPLAGSPQSG